MIKAYLLINYRDGTYETLEFASRQTAFLKAMSCLRQKRCTSVMLTMLPRSEEQI